MNKKIALIISLIIGVMGVIFVYRNSDLFQVLNTYRNASLVVVPPTQIYNQWVDEISKTKLKVFKVPIRGDVDDKKLTTKELDKYDIVLVNGTKYNQFIELVGNYVWKRVIIDEFDSLKIKYGMKEVRARFYWGVSATWMRGPSSNARKFRFLPTLFASEPIAASSSDTTRLELW